MTPSVEELLPHRRGMLLIDEVTHFENRCGRVRARVRPSRRPWQKGRFRKIWLVEVMAQAVGAIFSLDSRRLGRGTPDWGFLIAIDTCRIAPSVELTLEDELEVDVKLELDMHPMGVYSTQLTKGGVCLAEATMKFRVETGVAAE